MDTKAAGNRQNSIGIVSKQILAVLPLYATLYLAKSRNKIGLHQVSIVIVNGQPK
jgi:hypothetical protein